MRISEMISRMAHSGQFRWDGKTPYIVHPEAVAKAMKTDDESDVAWLHDVLEDTACTEFYLKKLGMSKKVIDAVKLMTKKKNFSYLEYILILKRNPIARNVKIADIRNNLSDIPSDHPLKDKYLLALYVLQVEEK